jgi:uncharacterized protein YndB with AHSA1/START domain
MAETARELTITRLFDAPRELVFRCWTDPDHLAKWFGPAGCTAPSVTADAVDGGTWRICVRDSAGVDHWSSGVYVEVVAPQRLVFSFHWDAEEGQEPEDTLVTIAFADRDGKTEMTFHQSGFVAGPSRDGHVEGWREAFDDLATYLEGEKT